jgi:8-oxo-dGTP diphosphatase
MGACARPAGTVGGVAIYLVRHAKAERRSTWHGDDALRPLSEDGRWQSDQLTARLETVATGRLVSSPARRCVETLRPLATRLGRGVETDLRLFEDRDARGAIALLEELPDGSVVSSHGDVIPSVVRALARDGLEVHGEPVWKKASVWVLNRARGRWTTAEAWAPPTRPDARPDDD